jgi:di/tricarboxylate transporter
MIEFPILFTLSVLILVVLSLTFLRVGPEFVLLGALTLLLVFGIVDAKLALSGFANEGLVTVAVLFVVAEGMRQTGGLTTVGQVLLGKPKSLRGAQARMMVPVAVMSAFLNNTPVVAMALPIINDWAKKFRLSVSHLMMPLSFAAILGGLTTLVGTSTTLVVNGLLIEAQQQAAGEAVLGEPISPPVLFPGRDTNRPGIGMFEIAVIGAPAAVLGVGYILLCSKWLIPERKPVMQQLDNPREYTVEMIVQPGSPLVGKTIEGAGLRHLPGVFLAEIDRGGHILAAVSRNERLQADDRLVFVGIVESVVDLQRVPGLKPATDQMFKLEGPRSERSLVEAVVSNSYPFLNMTIREAQFRSHYNAAVLAVARNGQRIQKKIGDIQLEPGDTLLLEAPPGFIELQRNSRDFFLISRIEDSTPPRHERAWIAVLILAVMVIAVTTGLLSMLKAAMLAAGLMIITRCCKGSEAKRSVDWGVLLTIAGGLGIGEALKSSGTDRFLADGLVQTVGSQALGSLAVIYGLTMVFTNIITAKAAAVLFFPIAMATAARLGVNAMPFAVAVMLASAASFATPVGYQTNLMVYGPGGYRASDYLRLGGPLSLMIWGLTILIAPLAWPFSVLDSP